MPRKGGLGHQGHAAIERAAAVGDEGPVANPASLQAEQPGETDIEIESLNWWDLPSSNPARPRCSQAAYDRDNQRLYVSFAKPMPGQDVYVYEGVDQREYRNFRRVVSPGKAINRTLNGKTYRRIEGVNL